MKMGTARRRWAQTLTVEKKTLYLLLSTDDDIAGEIMGHSKAVDTVSIWHQHPFCATTAGDDGQIVSHMGELQCPSCFPIWTEFSARCAI